MQDEKFLIFKKYLKKGMFLHDLPVAIPISLVTVSNFTVLLLKTGRFILD